MRQPTMHCNAWFSLTCPVHGTPVELEESESRYIGSCGCKFPVIRGIPRFVPTNNYASSFGLQWNTFRRTQLDSYTGLPVSRDRLTRLMGGTLDLVRGKSILEAGCGAGRFTEILLEAGGRVFATDISAAVEANYENCQGFEHFFVCQSDITALPLRPGQFDVVVCIGVIQHTPNPEKTIAALCAQVKEGGVLVIDHYTFGYPVTRSRKLIRSMLLRVPPEYALRFCETMVSILWPFHRYLARGGKGAARRWVKDHFLRLSPVVDYHDAYPQLSAELMRTWALLDTHDTVTDAFKHLRSAEQIASSLQNNGMTEIETIYAGNGVEARARRPKQEGPAMKGRQ